MSDQTNFKPMQITEPAMVEGAKQAQVRPEGSRKGRDTYQSTNKTSRNSESKSLPRKHK
jgi:hypothetical protein